MELEESAKKLYNSMKDLGTDENEIIDVLCHLSNNERQDLKKLYMTMYGKDLEKQLKSELSGHFEDGVIGLLMDQNEFEARMLRKAMKGAGTNEDLLIEILCPKEGYEVQEISSAYKRLFNRELLNDISEEQGGYFGRVLMSLSSGGRPTTEEPDLELAEIEAEELYQAGEGKLFGTDESEMIRILCSRSFIQLQSTFEIYEEKYETLVEEAIKSENSGDFEKALNVIVRCVKNRSSYYAELLYKSMKGLGTNDEDLIRILVSRAGKDLEDIKNEYANMYDETLFEALQGDLSGKYEVISINIYEKKIYHYV